MPVLHRGLGRFWRWRQSSLVSNEHAGIRRILFENSRICRFPIAIVFVCLVAENHILDTHRAFASVSEPENV